MNAHIFFTSTAAGRVTARMHATKYVPESFFAAIIAAVRAMHRMNARRASYRVLRGAHILSARRNAAVQ